MLFIAHRGNLYGPNLEHENKPEYLLNAINEGYYVETDLWLIDDKLYLGHDNPQYEISITFLLEIKNNLFCHCKNISALHFIISNYPEIECFYHDKDDCVLTSKNHIWNFPGSELTNISICVMPERVEQYISKYCYGVCTDYVVNMKHNETIQVLN